MPNYRVGILGATGAVGQKFIRLLENHPWFEITALGASERSAGRKYREAARWVEQTPLPESVAELTVRECKSDDFKDVDLVFSGLDSSVAEEIESDFARAGIPVVSNARNFRMEDQVPLLVPEVNPDHTELIRKQNFTPDGKGWIATNPNCVVVPLVMALKPLQDRYGIESVVLTSMQAISGAGYPGVPSLDIMGNVIPFIGGEEPKIHSEPLKILGTLDGDRVNLAEIPIQATATRVPVRNGHLLAVSVNLVQKPADADEVIGTLRAWQNPLRDLGLPSAPEYPLYVYEEENYPQPMLHVDDERGMRTSVGRVRKTEVMDYSFIAMAHNTIRGAAGGAILSAELLAARGFVTNRN